MWKRAAYLILSLILLLGLGSCGTTNTGAVLGGAALGNSVGGAIGGLVGDSRHGWHGSYRGSAIGSIVGTLAGAAIGNALTTPRREKQTDSMYPERLARTNAAPESFSAFGNLQIRRIRFVDDNRNHIIDANENCKVIFEVINEGDEPVYNVVPCVAEVSGAKHIQISPSVMVEEIRPRDGIKYTASISAGKRLRSGNVTFRLSVADSYGHEYAVKEFTLETQR